MTTPHWQVFSVYQGSDDRFVFGLFETDEPKEAEAKAQEMMEPHDQIPL